MSEDLTVEQKAALFDKIQIGLWKSACGDNMFLSILAACIIQTFEIPGPKGEIPEEA